MKLLELFNLKQYKKKEQCLWNFRDMNAISNINMSSHLQKPCSDAWKDVYCGIVHLTRKACFRESDTINDCILKSVSVVHEIKKCEKLTNKIA